MKKCSRCNKIKTLECFTKDNTKTTGVSSRCRDCQKEVRNLKAKKVGYRKGASLYANLSPKARENERIRKKLWKKNNPHVVAAINRRTYVKRKKLSIECTTKEVKNFMNNNICCVKCGTTKDLTLDHIIPVSWGLISRHSLDNFQVLCNSCNGAKRDRESIDYRPIEPDMNFDIRNML